MTTDEQIEENYQARCRFLESLEGLSTDERLHLLKVETPAELRMLLHMPGCSAGVRILITSLLNQLTDKQEQLEAKLGIRKHNMTTSSTRYLTALMMLGNALNKELQETKRIAEWRVEQLRRKLLNNFDADVVRHVELTFPYHSVDVHNCTWEHICQAIWAACAYENRQRAYARHQEAQRKNKLLRIERDAIVQKITNIQRELQHNPTNSKAVTSLTKWQNKLVTFDNDHKLLHLTDKEESANHEDLQLAE